MTDERREKKTKKESDKAHAMSLEAAYQSLEKVRKFNLEIEFGREIDCCHECVLCLRKNAQPAAQTRVMKWRHFRKKMMEFCFLCGTPVCELHRSILYSSRGQDLVSAFNFCLCPDCERLFSGDHALQGLLHSESEKQLTSQILDVYDRALLIFQYSLKWIEEIACALDAKASRRLAEKVAAGTTNVLSDGLCFSGGVTTLVVPIVGIPLVLTGLLFAGIEYRFAIAGAESKFSSEPNKLADRIIGLFSALCYISGLPSLIQSVKYHPKKQAESESRDANERIDRQKDEERKRMERLLGRTLKEDRCDFEIPVFQDGDFGLCRASRDPKHYHRSMASMRTAFTRIRSGSHSEKASYLRFLANPNVHLEPTDALASELELALYQHHQFVDRGLDYSLPETKSFQQLEPRLLSPNELLG